MNKRIAASLAVAGENIEQALEQLVDQADLAHQVAQLRRELSTERAIGNDRFEALNRKLDRILEQLGTNGSGGHG